MTDRHPFYDSHKFEALEESVRQIVFGLFAPVDQCSYGGNEINENGEEFWVNFHYAFANDSTLTVRCDLEYHGQCASLKQIKFLY
jgi:hypothetical protein